MEAAVLRALRQCKCTAVRLFSSWHRGGWCTAEVWFVSGVIAFSIADNRQSKVKVCLGKCRRYQVACICSTTSADQHHKRTAAHHTPHHHSHAHVSHTTTQARLAHQPAGEPLSNRHWKPRSPRCLPVGIQNTRTTPCSVSIARCCATWNLPLLLCGAAHRARSSTSRLQLAHSLRLWFRLHRRQAALVCCCCW
jgi:hypothetical protein